MKKVGNLVVYKGKVYVPVKARFPRGAGKSLCAGCTFLGLDCGELFCSKSDNIPFCSTGGEDYIYKDAHRHIVEVNGELFERVEVTDGRNKEWSNICVGCAFSGLIWCTEHCNPAVSCEAEDKDYIFVPLDEERARQIQQEVEAEEDRERKEVRRDFVADLIGRIEKVIGELESIKDDIFNYESITKKDC